MSEIKPWRGPRNKKVTPEMKKKMKKLREAGLTYKEIADEFNLSQSAVHYQLNSRTRELAKLGMTKHYKIHGHYSERYPEKRKKYMREYMRERYRNDPEFRSRMNKHNRKYQEKIRSSNKSEDPNSLLNEASK